MKFIYSILSLLLLFACKTSEKTNDDVSINEAPQNEIVIELAAGSNSGFESATKKVITDQDEFTHVWEEAYRNFLNRPKPPKVDFNEYQIVLVAMGMKTSGGYSIKIESINNTSGNYLVNVLETSPGKSCVTTEVVTFPFQLIQVKKAEGKTLFKVSEKIINCKSE